MNNKKNKSKSHGKPIKTARDENMDDIEVVKSESLNTNETKVPELVAESSIIAENDQLINDVPKKPKRNKGKKKKESLFEDTNTKEEKNDTKDMSENIENITQDNIPIVPCVRKKKKKSKKHDEISKENIECHDQVMKSANKDSDKETCVKLEKDESVPENIQIMHENINIVQDAVPCKKKKKKKHRNDSEKSDTHDSCISAFQKLIEPLETSIGEDNNNESREIQEIKDENKDVTESKEVPFIYPNEISEELKSAESTIKKSKKNKKNRSEHTVENFGERSSETVTVKSVSKENLTLLENCENISIMKETSPKPKAKIAKPVQKKRRNKSESETVNTSVNHNLNINTSEGVNVEISKTEEIIKKINTIESESNPDNIFFKDITVSSVSDANDIQESNIDHCQSKQGTFGESEDLNNLEKMSEIKKDPEKSAKNCDDLGFVEVKTGKGKKKRNKSVFTPDANISTETKSLNTEKEKESLNLDIKLTKDKTENTSEDLETHKIIIPDLIEYPRSTSQQYVNSNNNTHIQEITSTDEVKLNIPVYTSAPIIQGSGESPEAKMRNDPVAINVTEIKSQPGSSKDQIILQPEKNKFSENTDIKSKMIEVNRDMEELRLSIERSLAELTAIEKNDTEVDKEFEEIFQNQTAELPTTDIMDSKNKDHKSSIHVSEKKCDIEDVVISEKSEETKYNIEFKETEDVKAEDEDFHKNKESSNDSLISGNKEIKKSAGDVQKLAPVCPVRKEKGKNKAKKKGPRDVVTTNSNTNTTMMSGTQIKSTEKDSNQKSEKSEQNSENTQEKSKQQTLGGETDTEQSQIDNMSFEPIENFEDALTSSIDDINKTFEMIANDATHSLNQSQNPQINIISPAEDSEGEEKNDIKKKQNPISRPKNLLGHPNIPVSSNKTDFKKEKSKSPNSIQAKVKIKDTVEIEKAMNKKLLIDTKKNLIKQSNEVDSIYRMKANEDLIYKYSFRKVFLQSTCHVCKTDLIHRVPCKFCSLVFYCSQKHKDEDWSQHQSLCFAVCTIAHLKEQKHIYADAQNILGHNYRVLRMQTILSCEKILNRKLVPWEQEVLLYPRICSDVKCRQWKQIQLEDCAGCGQISYCSDHPDHLPSSHQRWCKSYALYQKLVNYQLTKGRLEPPLPTKVLSHYQMPGKINDVLGSMYEDKIDMNDIQYAALTQIATAPLTAAYSYQLYSSKINSICANGMKKNSTFTIHMVGTELPFEADSLNKWEIFFLHLRSDVQDLRVVMVGPDINSSKLPLDLLANIKLCENCQINKRRVLFDFHDDESYHEYYLSDGFVTPDIVCAFNPNIYRSSAYNIETWPPTINSILKQRVPFVLTSYSIEELRRDLGKVREFASVDYNVVSEIKYNPYSSVRPDRNFITDHEIPLLFKNYCFCILCGTL